ncbi:MAG TPA: hypothetical protein VEW46_17070 [Pyrinomonadaceae bacterium]|nr:hypothetical protein [Pyrinomonadaceae bacterium]
MAQFHLRKENIKTMGRTKGLVLSSLGLLSLLLLLEASCRPSAPVAPRTELAVAPGSCGPVTFTIDPTSSREPWIPPSDIKNGAASATLQDAGIFAWQEFIALNWPAVPQTGQVNTREQPNPTAIFGDPKYSGAQAAGPLVWHTYRNKVEIFPGTGQPPGYAGSTASTFFGYDHPPTYIYGNGEIPPFATPSPSASPATPWINLDEQSEIGLDTMYAGTLTSANLPFPGQQILFLAKANRAEYTYVAANGWWDSGSSWNAAKNNTKQYIAGFYGNPQAYVEPSPGSTSSPAASPTPYVSFPTNTIEVKSAWRQLTAKEASSGRFYTTTVRFYNKNSSSQVGYIDAVWGLVALHIIQKTQSAPYFIYATFSQADNILDANGNCIEDEEGNLRYGPCGQASTAKPSPTAPLDPNVTSTPATGATPQTPQNVQQLAPANSNQTLQTVGQRLFYINTPTSPTPPPTTQGLIAVNQREHNIPQCIIDVNTAAHAAIKTYGQQNNNNNPVWLYYKLINVQYQPYDKPAGTIYTGASGGPDPSTYYQANEVVETNYNLQVFSGQFQNTLPSPNQNANINNLITDYNSDSTSSLYGTPFKNVFYSTSAPNSGKSANMGGCMGCHGNAQVAGADFSFIFKGGRVSAPDVGTPPTPTPSETGLAKFRKLLLE